MPRHGETRTVRIAAPLTDEKVAWMARFGWSLTAREDRPYAGDLLVERRIALRAEAPADFSTVAVLRFARTTPGLTVIEAEFWHPTLLPGWVDPTLTLLRWAALSLPLVALQWVVLLPAVDHGSDAAVRMGLWAFVGPTLPIWGLAVLALTLGTRWVRRLERDPAVRERRGRARQEWALQRAEAILRRAQQPRTSRCAGSHPSP
jgi:hypothetical protein